MKTSWADIILFCIASVAGAFFYQWTKDVPNWQDAAYSGFSATWTLITFGIWIKVFNKE